MPWIDKELHTMPCIYHTHPAAAFFVIYPTYDEKYNFDLFCRILSILQFNICLLFVFSSQVTWNDKELHTTPLTEDFCHMNYILRDMYDDFDLR